MTAQTREQVVAEALTWFDTPYHLTGMVKGAGVDCATFPYCVYKACGIIPAEDVLVDRYSHDWFRNTTDERYLKRAMLYAPKIMETICRHTVAALPGNLVMSRAAGSQNYNHSCIVVKWPHVIHAVSPKVELACAATHRLLAYKQIVILDPWQPKEIEAC